LKPSSLTIVNDSHKHAGHIGNPSKDPNAETHFDVSIESDAFKGKTRVQQHRMIYDLLDEEFGQGLHALALKTKAPA
jgi:stress-induced morphogen